MPNDNESFFDPVDLAMFAGPRASVPLMSLLYSKEANAGQDYERFAQQRAYEMAMAERQRNAQIQRAIEMRRQQELDARIPPEVQRFYINSRYDPTTATRRVDYETPPVRNFGSPGSEMRAAPRRFQKGGSARKTLQQMMDELLVRGTKTAAKGTPDIGRRALFGLRPQLDLPLAKLHPDIEKATESRITKALKGAPQVTEKSVEVNPTTGSIKSTLQSVVNTPLSRRTVLSATAGQALRNLIPGLDDLAPGVGDVAKVANTVVKAAAPAAIDSMIPALMARAVKMGLDESEAVNFVRQNLPVGVKGADNFDMNVMHYLMTDPYNVALHDEMEPISRLRAMREILQQPSDTPPMGMRGALRGVREESPDLYQSLRETAADIRDFSHEN
jgi:hypothetical protein